MILLMAAAGCHGTAPAAHDPQAAIEPRSDPGSGQAFLSRMAGDWDVVKTFHPREGEPVSTRGTCHQEMLHGGRFLRSEFVFHAAEGDSTGTGVIGFDAESGRFTSVWYDSRSTRMSIRQSDDPFDGEQILLHSRSVDPGGSTRISRTVTRFEDGGRRLVHRQLAPVAGGGERPIMELVMTRR